MEHIHQQTIASHYFRSYITKCILFVISKQTNKKKSVISGTTEEDGEKGRRRKYRESFFSPIFAIMAANKLVLEGRVSINAFILGLSVVIIPLIRAWFGHLDWVFDYLTETPGKIAICVHIAVANGLLLIIYRGPLYKVSLMLDELSEFI